jgi:hypothetical protein
MNVKSIPRSHRKLFVRTVEWSTDIMNERRLVMITDPFGGAGNRPSSLGPKLASIEEEMRSFDLCGRSWADWPNDMAELIFNTFKPIFCSGRDGAVSLISLAEHVHWMILNETLIETVQIGIMGDTQYAAPSRPSLLIICSDMACRTVLGKSMASLFAHHIRRDDAAGERSGMFIGEIGLPASSPIAELFSETDGIEIILVPRPSEAGRMAIKPNVKGVPKERVEELRMDYVRRVHKELGCNKHSLW